MKERFTTHATFQIERIYQATPERVFTAWSNKSSKARWYQPAEVFDFRVGGREFSQGGPAGGPVFTFDAYYQEIVPNERLVYSYSLDQGEIRISVSIATIELIPTREGTKLVFTEQGTFFDGHDTPEQREQGTKELLDLLGKSLGERNAETFELVSRRKFDAPRNLVYRAWTEPDLLAQWWGPNGFTNTFHTFDLRPGGVWEYTMHGPDGEDYPNRNVFQEIGPECIVLRHESGHHFILTATFEEVEGGTVITFRQTLQSKEDYNKLKLICEEGNEQNLDRLGSLLKRIYK
ncbi:SRPBCC family protein [Fictibacillus sp. NRS-1165]|uniref:SRPBCC family protein n=1 Tax=Fictibacillus sp. NRS-1165 TaxID=3144463 RepID=UPI003D20132E